MPVILAVAVRYIIMAAVQLGLFALVEKYVLPLIDKAIEETAQVFGATQDEAQDIAANEVLQAAEDIGIFAVTLKTKLPIKVAERLGFTTKGWSKRALFGSTKSKVEAAAKLDKTTVAATQAEATAVAKAVSVSTQTTFQRVNDVASFIAKIVGIPVGTLYMLAQFLDYASWSGSAYQKTFQAFFANFGLNPKQSLASASLVSSDMWNKIYNYYKIRGAIGLTDPFGTSDYPYTAENLAKIVDKAAAAIIADNGKPTFDNVIGATQLMIVFKDGNPVEPAGSSSSSTSGTSTPPATNSSVNTQIFTGVVANGVLGASKPFESVGDGYITSNDDLMQTAAQTLSNFVLTLPASFHYEIAIVSHFRSPGGFSLKGEAVRIVSGYNKDNTPRYKTIYKKFAVMKIYLFDKNGRKVLLLEENMGQVNATDYTPTTADLAKLATSVPVSLFTTDVDKITGIVSNSPVTVASPAPTPQPASVTVTPPPAQVVVATPAPAPAPAPVVPAAPAIAKTVPLNEAAGVPFSYGSMGTTSPQAIAAYNNVSLADLAAVNQRWWQNVPITNYTSMDISIMMRNYNVPPVNIPASTTPPAAMYRTNTGSVGLNIRAEADLQAAILDSLPNGSTVIVQSAPHAQDGYNWVIVQYATSAGIKHGYAALEYLVKI